MKIIRFVLFQIVFLLVSFNLSAQDRVYWEKGRDLSWEDFKGTPPANPQLPFRFEPYINYELGGPQYVFHPLVFTSCYFNNKTSWLLPESATETTFQILEGHFALMELQRRRADRKMKIMYNDSYRKLNLNLSEIWQDAQQEINLSVENYYTDIFGAKPLDPVYFKDSINQILDTFEVWEVIPTRRGLELYFHVGPYFPIEQSQNLQTGFELLGGLIFQRKGVDFLAELYVEGGKTKTEIKQFPEGANQSQVSIGVGLATDIFDVKAIKAAAQGLVHLGASNLQVGNDPGEDAFLTDITLRLPIDYRFTSKGFGHDLGYWFVGLAPGYSYVLAPEYLKGSFWTLSLRFGINAKHVKYGPSEG